MSFLVVNQRQNVDVAEIRKDSVVEDSPDLLGANNVSAFLCETRKHGKCLVGRELERPIAVGLEAYGKFIFGDLIDDLDVFLLGLGSIQIFSHMHGTEVVHVLVDEFGNRDLGEVTVGLVPDKPHCENVA